MKRTNLTLLSAVGLVLLLAGCSGAPMPLPTPAGSMTSSPEASAIPTPTPTAADDEDEVDAEPALIAPRIAATCGNLVNATLRAQLAGVADDELERVHHPLANGSAAELQAGVLTCQWIGPAISDESTAQIDIKVLPDAAAEFAAFVPPTTGSEVSGTLGAGSTISCFDYAPVRSCYVHFLAGAHWVDASFIGLIPTPTVTSTAAATDFATAISQRLLAAGSLGAAYVPPSGSVAVWSSCNVLDDLGAFRTAMSSPSLTSPEAEFTGAGTLFSEAWQRVSFKSCSWRQADPYSSPTGEIRMASVTMLPGAEWAWPSLHESYLSRGGVDMAVAGADQATLSCSSDDDCTIDALVRGSYISVYLSVDQNRGGAAALAVTAAEFVIARL